MGKRGVWTPFVVALLLWGGAQVAQATVVYHWHPVSDDPDISIVSGSLAVSDAAYQAGHVDYTYVHHDGSPSDPGAPFEQLAIVVGQAGSLGSLGVSVQPTDGGDWSASMSLLFGQYLAGSLDVNNSASNYTMQSANVLALATPLWTLSQFNSDYPLGNGACFFAACAGATGYWVLDQATVPVPEPPTRPWFGLLACGLIALAWCRRVRTRSRN